MIPQTVSVRYVIGNALTFHACGEFRYGIICLFLRIRLLRIREREREREMRGGAVPVRDQKTNIK